MPIYRQTTRLILYHINHFSVSYIRDTHTHTNNMDNIDPNFSAIAEEIEMLLSRSIIDRKKNK